MVRVIMVIFFEGFAVRRTRRCRPSTRSILFQKLKSSMRLANPRQTLTDSGVVKGQTRLFELVVAFSIEENGVSCGRETEETGRL